MKTIKKKILPAMLAFLVAITSILPTVLNPPKAYAKNHDLDLRRVGDWKFYSESLKRDVRSEIFYIDGEWAFCIEPGIAMKRGKGREVSAKSLGLSQEQMEKLALIVWYGYRSQDEDEFDYFFTQSAVWRYLGSKQVHYRKGKKKEDLAKFDTWYKKLMNKVNSFHDEPSFNGDTIKVKQGETANIRDKNGVLSGLKIAEITGGKAVIDGNILKVTPNGSKDKMEISFNRGMTPQQTRTQFIVKKGNNQAVSYLSGKDPYDAGVTIEVDKTGGVKLNKTVEFLKEADHRNYTQGSWASIVFELYSEELGKLGEYKLGDFEDGNIKIDNLAIGKYYFLEKNQPKGYIENKVKIPFEIKEGENKKILGATLKVENNLTRIAFVKKDNDGNIIKGAKLKIENEKGETVHSFISKESPYIIEGLAQGEYTLTEEEAPKGFVRSKEKVKFRVTNDEKLVAIEIKNKHFSIIKKNVNGEALKGAKFQILDKNKNIVDTFISDGNRYEVKNLKAGETYTLREIKAPKGYALMRDLLFTVKDAMTDEILEAINKKVNIKKVDKEGNILSGAEFDIIDKETGDKVDSFTSSKDGYNPSNLVEGKTYILRETKAPEGYVKMQDTEFTVTAEKETQEITAVNKQVKILKENSKGEPLEGATFDIIDKETGDKVDSFTSSKEGYNPNNLAEGKTYILRETKAPNGYSLMQDTEFTVTAEKETQEITAVNKQVSIKKVTQEGKPLKGAKMQILDSKGEIIEEFTTTDENYVAKNLKEGETYTLREIEAPEGYERAEDIKFTVESGKNQIITMVDKDKKGWIELEDKFKYDGTVKTGDKRVMTVYLAAILLASIGITSLATRKRKKDK